MANKNPPAHDFAPAWLKIPTYNYSQKPSGAPSERGGHTSRRDEHNFGFPRHNKESDSLASHHSYFNDYRKDRDDFDEAHSSNPYFYGMDAFFNGSCNNQMLLSRRPHSRHDFRISLSYPKTDSSNKHMTNNSGGYYNHKGKGKFNDSTSSNNGISDGRGIGVHSNNFNQEFPSLQGDITEEPSTLPALNGSVWEKPRSIKIHNSAVGKKIQLIKKPTKNENSENSRKSPASSSSGSLGKSSTSSSPHTVIVSSVAKGTSNCRALTPAAKNAIPLTKKMPKEGTTIKLINKKSPVAPSPSSHSMEILVKHPKAPGNKSEFLKALRNEQRDHENLNNGAAKDNSLPDEGSEEHQVNGVDMSKLSFSDKKENSILSSSLEAEERLLREMGWKEEVSDDENYAPLTEDELKEFRDREQVIKKNGIRRNLLANLSPLRLAPFPGVPPPMENSSSSSDSDSDA